VTFHALFTLKYYRVSRRS